MSTQDTLHVIRSDDQEDYAETIDGEALSNADSFDTSGYADPNAIYYDHSSPPSFHSSYGVPLSYPSAYYPIPPTTYYPSGPSSYNEYYGGPPSHSMPFTQPHPTTYYTTPPPYTDYYSGAYSTQPTPAVAAPAPTVMCCYHKRGVCKKTGDCWYSHDGSEDTPCHYGVKCAAGHAVLSRTALAGQSSNKSVPAWARHPFKHTRDPLAMRKGGDPRGPMRLPHPPPPPPPPFKHTEKAPQPPLLENETCKFCNHNQLYLQPYRAHSGHGQPTLQYRVHCMQCHGSWTPTTTTHPSLPPNGGDREAKPT